MVLSYGQINYHKGINVLSIDQLGRIQHPNIKLAISPSIERGEMPVVNGIIIHQTASATAQATLNGYRAENPNGAHLLIDKDGTIYQTASLYKKTFHVGFIKSRCLARRTCDPADLQKLKGKRVGKEIGRVEAQKPYPLRYPTNNDSIGVEIVSMAINNTFESVTTQQQSSLTWLLIELEQTLRLSPSEVFRHSEVSWKQESEGASAQF